MHLLTAKIVNRIYICSLVIMASIGIALKRDDGYDFFWYLGAGNLMHGSKQLAQPFTAQGLPWHNHEWLFHWIIGLSPQPSLFHLLLKIILITAIILIIYFFNLKRYPEKYYWALFISILAGILSSEFFALRAQLGSYFLFMLTWFILTSALSETKKAVLLAPVMLIWANIHGAFVMGIALVFYHQIFIFVQSRLKKEKIHYLSLIPILVVILFPIINPYGLEVYVYPIKWVGNEIYKDYIREWTSVIRWPSLFYPYLIFAIIALFLIIIGKPIKLLEFIPFVIFMILPLTAVRHLPFFYMFSTLLITESIKNIIKQTHTRKIDLFIFKDWIWGIIIIIAFCFYIILQPRSVRSADPVFQKYAFPTGAIAFMKDNNLNGRLLNAYQWGGYLWWKGYDIFIDGRLDTLYPESVFRDFTDIVTTKSNWKDILNKWQISFVLYDTRLKNQTPKLNDALMKNNDWMILYQDPVATLFARKESLDPDFLFKYQTGALPIPDEPMCQYAAGMTLLHRDGPASEIKRYLKRAIELDPVFAQPHVGLARILIKEKKYSDALIEIKRAEKLGLRGAELDDLREIASQNQ